MFYFNQFLHNISNFFKNLILIIFKWIKSNYVYVYEIKKKISCMNAFTFHNDMKPHDTKMQVTNQKNSII